MAALISIDRAQEIVLSTVAPGPTVGVPLRTAVGCTLAEPVICDIDYPPFDRAMMDGYAVRAADTASTPVVLEVVGQIAAGANVDPAAPGLQAGQAVQINTGAPVPSGADAVVRVEDTGTDGMQVTVNVSAEPGQHIGRRAEYTQAGQTVLEPGGRLTPGQVAIAAAAGRSSLLVYRQPAVAILATGDELIEVDRVPTGGQIRDSNRYLLDGLVRQGYCQPLDLGVAGDDRDTLIARIKEGLIAEFLCITGGVSMGQFDFVPECLQDCGATVQFHKLALKPGKPALFATVGEGSDDRRYVFALPGNPVSVLVSFLLLVRPALAKWQGLGGGDDPLAQLAPRPVQARLTGPIGGAANRQTYRPARVTPDEHGQLCAEPLSWHGSGDPFGLARANALTVTPPGSPGQQAGADVQVLLLDGP
ncbi:MAG: molybdopterin molybdotransferase MoeA [bacterium]|nr:molybdopterin molybdotransferase MoeA [bacterium]